MTQSSNQQRPGSRSDESPRLPRSLLLLTALGLAGFVAAAFLLWDASSTEPEQVLAVAPAADPGPVHVHGLGVNPADGALFIATHTGLFRVGREERKARRVAARFQDTMGFTVAGPDRFLGSGHPDLREAEARGWPPSLGLIESNDAGDTWEAVALLGEADFHVLRAAGRRVYGYDIANDRLLVSEDDGRRWSERPAPGGIFDLVATPEDPDRVIAAAAGGVQDGLFESQDGGLTWRRTSAALGLLALPDDKTLYLVSGGGGVFASTNGGRDLAMRGTVDREPAALYARNANELYVALHDGTIKQSRDGGRRWRVRSTP